MTNVKEFSKGSKLVTIQRTSNGFEVWVGFVDQNEGSIPARFFKEFSTCSQTFKREAAAVAAINKFFG